MFFSVRRYQWFGIQTYLAIGSIRCTDPFASFPCFRNKRIFTPGTSIIRSLCKRKTDKNAQERDLPNRHKCYRAKCSTRKINDIRNYIPSYSSGVFAKDIQDAIFCCFAVACANTEEKENANTQNETPYC